MSGLSEEEEDSLDEEDSEEEDSEDESGEETEGESDSESAGEELPSEKELITEGVQQLDVSSSSDEGGERERCPVCLNRFIGQDLGIPENCEHVFCLECIKEWSKNVNTCPIDRNEFDYVHLKTTPDGKVLKKIRVRVQSKGPEDSVVVEDSTLCEVCRLGDREDRLLLCDACDLAYHCDCLDPPLFRIPIEEWFCPPCSGVMTQLESSGAIPSASRSRRVIPRTRASETVRVRVQNRRTYPSASSPRSTSVQRPKKRKRRTYRRCIRKVVKLARTKGAMGSGKGGKAERATAVMVTYRKRYKRRRRRKTKKATRLPSRTTEANIQSAKERIAKRLGLVKARTGVAMPDVKSRPGPSQGGSSSDRSHSLFGTRDQLMDFNENFNEDQAGPSTSSTNRNPQGRSEVSADPLNFLDSILEGQKILHSKSDKVVIRNDGSLILQEDKKKASLKTSNASRSVVRLGLYKPDVSIKGEKTENSKSNSSSLLHSALTKKSSDSHSKPQHNPGTRSSDLPSNRSENIQKTDKYKSKRVSSESSPSSILHGTTSSYSSSMQQKIQRSNSYSPNIDSENSRKTNKKDKHDTPSRNLSNQHTLTKKKSDLHSKRISRTSSDSADFSKNSCKVNKRENKRIKLEDRPSNLSHSKASKKSDCHFKHEQNTNSDAFDSSDFDMPLEMSHGTSSNKADVIPNHRMDILQKRASFLKKFEVNHAFVNTKEFTRNSEARDQRGSVSEISHSTVTGHIVNKMGHDTLEGNRACKESVTTCMPPILTKSTSSQINEIKVKEEPLSSDEEPESESLIGQAGHSLFSSRTLDSEFEASESLIKQSGQGQFTSKTQNGLAVRDSSSEEDVKPFIKNEPISSDESSTHLPDCNDLTIPKAEPEALAEDMFCNDLDETQDLQTPELAATQRAVSFKDLLCTQTAKSIDDLPCTQAVGSFEDLPCTQAVESFEDFPYSQAEHPFENLPCTQAVESNDNLPCTQAVETFEDLPCTQAVQPFEDLPCTQAVQPFEDIPCTQAVQSFEDLPCAQAVETFKDLPCTQTVETFEDLPCTQAVETFEDLPCTQAVQPFEDLPCTQAVQSFEDLPCTQAVKPFEDLPCTQAAQPFEDLPCTQAAQPFEDLPCTQAVQSFEGASNSIPPGLLSTQTGLKNVETLIDNSDLPSTQVFHLNKPPSCANVSDPQFSRSKKPGLKTSVADSDKQLNKHPRQLKTQVPEDKEMLEAKKAVALLRNGSKDKVVKTPKVVGVHKNLPQVLTSVPIRRPLVPKPINKRTFSFEQVKQHFNLEEQQKNDMFDIKTKPEQPPKESNDTSILKTEFNSIKSAHPDLPARGDFDSLSKLKSSKLSTPTNNVNTSSDEKIQASLSKEPFQYVSGIAMYKSKEQSALIFHSMEKACSLNNISQSLLQTEIVASSCIKKEPLDPVESKFSNQNSAAIGNVGVPVGESNLARALRIKREMNAEVLQQSIPFKERLEMQSFNQGSSMLRTLSIKQEKDLEAMRQSATQIAPKEIGSVRVKIEKEEECDHGIPCESGGREISKEVDSEPLEARSVKREAKEKQSDNESKSHSSTLEKSREHKSEERSNGKNMKIEQNKYDCKENNSSRNKKHSEKTMRRNDQLIGVDTYTKNKYDNKDRNHENKKIKQDEKDESSNKKFSSNRKDAENSTGSSKKKDFNKHGDKDSCENRGRTERTHSKSESSQKDKHKDNRDDIKKTKERYEIPGVSRDERRIDKEGSSVMKRKKSLGDETSNSTSVKSNYSQGNKKRKTSEEDNEPHNSDKKNKHDYKDSNLDNKKSKKVERYENSSNKIYSNKRGTEKGTDSSREKDFSKHSNKSSYENHGRKESRHSKTESSFVKDKHEDHRADINKNKEKSRSHEDSFASALLADEKKIKKEAPYAEKGKRSPEDRPSHSTSNKSKDNGENKRQKTSEEVNKPHSKSSSRSYKSPDSTSGPERTGKLDLGAEIILEDDLLDPSSRKRKVHNICDTRESKRQHQKTIYCEDTSSSDVSQLSNHEILGTEVGSIKSFRIKEEQKPLVTDHKNVVKLFQVERSSQDLKEDIASEIKDVLKPFFTVGVINKDDYKDIMRRAVPKVFLNCGNCINPEKIKKLVLGYIAKMKNS